MTMKTRWLPCYTPDCPGDGRYAAPGRGHREGCHHPLTQEDLDAWKARTAHWEV